MMEFTSVNGMKWPASDTDCRAVVFNTLGDIDQALRYVRRTRVVVQAGGNCGVWPKYMAKFFETVHTFEPEPTNFECLASNCNEPNIVMYNNALGARSALVSIEFPEGIRNIGACRVAGFGNIPQVCIDDLRLDACDFIQLDVEGYEYEALEGARATIERYHPVVMLEDKGLSVKYGHPENWSLEYMKALNYKRMAHINRDMIYA